MGRFARASFLLTLPAVVLAADQPLGGKALVAKRSAASDVRRLAVRAVEAAGATLSGDPTVPPGSSGGMLHVRLEGGTPSEQTFVLPQGTARDGRPHWRALDGEGFEYRDRFGERGPVRGVRLRRASTGALRLAVKLRGDLAAMRLVPPDPGTAGALTVALVDGDRYCARFGADGRIRNDGARSFSVTRPASRGCPASVAGEFLALGYNVAGLPQGISGSDPEVNTPLIAPRLNGYDLVLLQESWKTPEPNPLAPVRVYHEILEAGSLHPFKTVSAPLPLGTNPDRTTAVVSDGLNTFSRFPFGEVTRVPWSTCHASAADCLATKGFSVVRMTVAPGAMIDVYDLHMEAGGDPEDDAARDLDVTQLSGFIQANSSGRPIIVGGDFNLHTNGEPDRTQFERLLAETGLADVCAALACPEPGRIDKFLFRSSAAVTITPLSWRFETDVFMRADGEPLSDHDALAVRFAWAVTGS